MRIFIFHLSIQVLIYLLFAFVTFDIFWVVTADLRVRMIFIVVSLFLQGMISSMIYNDYRELPNFLKTPTHEEKKSSIKKYIGELHEELALYGEAMELQKKIKEFKSKQ